MAGLGVAVGLAVSSLLTGLMRTMLVAVAPRDPVAFAIAGATLVALAALASYIPARRALRLDPVRALRSADV